MSARTRDRDNIAVGKRIRKLREAHGLKQQALAVMLGNASHSAISEIELGKRRASMPILRELSRIFHVSVAYIIGEEPTAEHDAIEARALRASFRSVLERIQSCDAERAEAIQDAFSLLEQSP